MTKIFSFLACLSFITLFGQSSDGYHVAIDLINVENDQISVKMTIPYIGKETVEFHMPRVVPGTYSISDFGRFITDFSAFDNEGNPLEVNRLDINRWQISDATDLTSINYRVNDTFDQVAGYTENYIFEPGGTSFESERNVYFLNNFGTIGYVEGFLNHPISLTVHKDKELYGATALQSISRDSTTDTFFATNYHELTDSPILYTRPDTASFQVSNATVLVSLHSPNKKLSAKEIADNLSDLMEAQAQYLGGVLPVDRYAFLVYLMDYNSLSGSMGALEHAYSSMYTLPEARGKYISQTIRDVAAHEFFHIVTPLNIKAEQIHNFDYINPEMSAHLWLYEGVTEYSAMHMQAKYGLISAEAFLDEIKDKIRVSEQFPDVSFTEMSSNILDEPYDEMYLNVYYKGALIALCLDLYLIKYTDMDLQGLMRKLSDLYGKDKPFKDDDLIPVITSLSSPEIGEFLNKYVVGDDPLPIYECLEWVGITRTASQATEISTLGQVGLGLSENNALMIKDITEMNEFGHKIGFQQGDELVSINGMSLSEEDFFDTMQKFQAMKRGKKLIIVIRRNIEGQNSEIKLKGKLTKIERITPGELVYHPEPNKEMLSLKKQWLTPVVK